MPDVFERVVPRFTPRERDVLQLMADGKSANVSSVLLNISEHTVVYHRRNAMHKLGSSTTTLAVARAVALGVVTVDFRGMPE